AAMTAAVVVGLSERAPAVRWLFNTAMYALAVLASALPGMLAGVEGGRIHVASDQFTLLAFSGGVLYVSANVLLVSAAVALASGQGLRALVEDNIRHSGPAFLIMACIAGLAASLWKIRPQLEVLLAGPVFALALYQRYAYRTVLATRDAETDALTSLGNH